MRLQFETNTTGLLSGQPVFPCVDSIASQEYDDMTNDDDGILLVVAHAELAVLARHTHHEGAALRVRLRR